MNPDNHAPDLPELPPQDDTIEKIRDMVAKATEEAIAPLKELLAKKQEQQPPKTEDVGGKPQPNDHLRDQRAAYERSGLAELIPFDEFIKGIEA